ncbi:MAG TPA: DUF2778 domain-containing protein [Methylocella sp.]|nr:DUF2778 domain-containing protein [Methylocella sp.]
MSQAIDTDFDYIPYERGHERNRLLSKIFSHTIPGAAALALSASFGAWLLYVRPADAPHAVRTPAAAPAAPVEVLASNPYGGLVDPRSKPVSLAQIFPLEVNLKPEPLPPSAVIAENEDVPPPPAGRQFGENVPLPVPRPTELGSLESHGPLPAPGRRMAQQNRKAVASATPAMSADNRSFFEKLFGAPPKQPSGPALAYAAPEEGIFGNARSLPSSPPPRYDRLTAVYDVAAHTVYMPNGTRLEAHSGLGSRLDDPRYVSERMRGPTPPNVYELQPREALFHGVPALRLIPVGGGDVYGRTGLLAHTYMLGPNGDSNGCVSFRNYSAFLQAYRNGEIKRLAVVARVN